MLYVHSALWQHPSDSHDSQHGQGLPEDGGQSHGAFPIHQNPRVFTHRPAAGLQGRPHQSRGYHHQGKGCQVPPAFAHLLPLTRTSQQENLGSSGKRREEAVLQPQASALMMVVDDRCALSCGGSVAGV